MATTTASMGAFIPTTNIWDVAQVYEIDINSPEFKELLVRLYQNINNIALSVNIRDAGYYNTQEFVNGQLYFPNPALTSASPITPVFRQVYRQVVNFGVLPNTGTTSIAHNITVTPTTTFTRIYATASDPSGNNYVPIPYASCTAVADNIELAVTATNVVITTGSNRSNFTITYVVLEYLQT